VRTYDAIVIGLGAHGSATARSLARRGLRVLGLERGAEAGHEDGSSGGRSRIIRLAYFEDPAYVPLLLESWDAWLALERESGTTILELTGGLYAGSSGSEVFEGSVRSAIDHHLTHEVLDAAELRRRWPVFRFEDHVAGLFEERAGFLRPERGIDAALEAATRDGATLRFGERAVDWRPASGGGLEVETDLGVYGAEHLILTAGAWTPVLAPDLRLPLTIERVPAVWFEPKGSIEAVSSGRLPIWIIETDDDGAFYGFPYEPGLGLKIARHHSGEFVEPDRVERSVRPADVERIRAFARRRFPAADGPLVHGAVCLYTNTPDLHFVLDTHPAVPGVAYASACSGHGFKFAPVIGEILADLALTGVSSRPIERFRAGRFTPDRPIAQPV
jgi:sarcosine oxidase